MEYKNTLIYKRYRYWSFEAQDMRRRSDTLPACSSPVHALRTCRRDRHVPLLVLYISMSSEDNQSQRDVVLSVDPHNVNPRGRLVQPRPRFLCIFLRVRPRRRHPSVPAARRDIPRPVACPPSSICKRRRLPSSLLPPPTSPSRLGLEAGIPVPLSAHDLARY
ncbi:hypothetical protein B0H13DRAFT_2037365, partial [Mycena leptocephala]